MQLNDEIAIITNVNVRDGARAWRMVAAAFVSGFVVFGIVYRFGVFLQPMMTWLRIDHRPPVGGLCGRRYG